MQCHVIYGSNMGRDLQNMLEVDDLLVVLSSKHGPGCIIEFISQTIRLLKLEESRRNMLVITSSINLNHFTLKDDPISYGSTKIASDKIVA